jgi:hypothetical protein
MTNQLRDPLHDLLSGVPSYVVPDARSAWSTGARRRRRRRVGALAAVVVVVALLAAALGSLPRLPSLQPAGQPDRGVDGYPTRLEHPFWSSDLPQAPGPLAGVVRRVDGTKRGWYAVSGTGHLWSLPLAAADYPPALSPDGSRLAYLNPRSGQELGILDLRTGAWTSTDVGVATNANRLPWRLDRDAASSWSPDGRHLFVPVSAAPGNPQRSVDGLVVAATGGATGVRAPREGSRVVPAGWVSETRLAWLAWRPGSGSPVAGADLLVTDLRGRLLGSVRLDLDGYFDDFGGWVASVSPNGRVLSIGGSYGRLGDDVLWFSTRDGTLHATIRAVPDAAPACPSSWGMDTQQVPTSRSQRDSALVSVNGGVTILADPRLGVDCSVWATQALDGDAHEGLGGQLFGERTDWLAWHWREVAAGAGLAVLLVAMGWWWRRRRVSA